ncbi:MAG: glycerate kinase [Haloarculaceae archaeon]
MIEDRDALARTPAHELALSGVEAAVDAARPERVLRERVRLDGDRLQVGDASVALGEYDEALVLGGGKAAAHVAAVLEDVLGDRLDGGVVVTSDPVSTERVAVVAGDHPVPSERGVAGAERVLATAREADDRTLVLAVLTGGGSALLPAPADGVSLADLQSVTEALLDGGAAIEELNAVRRHCSALKGGRLADAAAPATVVGLLFSDVVGDDPAVIASGPTAPDPSTFADAAAVLDRYEVDAPAAIRERLERGAAGAVAETPGPGDRVFDRVTNVVLANAWTALDAARETVAESWFAPLVLSSRIEGEAREVAKTHAAVATEIGETGNPIEPPAVVLSAGETTVTVRGDGAGGPNCEFALSAAQSLPDGAVLAAVDTDGIDGDSGAAGGIVDASTVDDPAAAAAALAENDAATYLSERDALLTTGPTGTNVNDLHVLVVPGE